MNHETKKVPVLDLQVYVEDNKIIHEFYEKPVACKFVIPNSSAHSKSMNMSVLVEEGVRRMRNYSRGLEWEKSRVAMTSWSRKLQRSGYPATVRHQVIKAACNKYEKMCKDEEEGVRPVHRSRDWKRRERKREKEKKVTNWHQNQKGQILAPLILDPTAGNMTKEIKDVCKKFEQVTGMRVAVSERAGDAIKHVAKAEPLKKKGCNNEECFPCSTGGGQCRKNGAGYRIRCETCHRAGILTLYEGETGRNSFTRGLEHKSAIRLEDEENALWKHCMIQHGAVPAEFSMKVVGVHRICLVRQVNEAVRIMISEAGCIMNSKSEFHQAPLVRVVPTTGLLEEQGSGGGQGPGSATGRSSRGGRGGRSRGGRTS